MTTPDIPGFNRAERRRMMRQQGWRGSKAKRQFPDRSAHRGVTTDAIKAQQEKQAQAQEEHARRDHARRAGLLMPPSEAEMAHLKATGKIEHDPRLWVPGE